MAFLVLLHHLLPFVYPQWALPIELNLQHSVDVFFILSGFVLALVYSKYLPFTLQNFRAYGLARFARIAPLAFCVVLTYYAVFLFISIKGFHMNSGPVNISFGNLIGNLLFLDSVFPGFTSIAGAKWSVSVEVFAYIFIFPFVYLLNGNRLKLSIAFVVAVLVQLVFWHELSYLGRFFSRCLPAFITGAIIYYYAPVIKNQFWTCLLLVVGFICFVFCPDRMQVVSGSLIIVSALSDTSLVGRFFSSKVFIFLGDISYSLYLWHGLLVLLTAGLLKKYVALQNTACFWIIIPILLSIILGYLSYRFLELPCRKVLRDLFNSNLKVEPVAKGG